ncbi:LuxR C-terminal-related transcriptional regulator [Streptomyces xinghaiensis]|uniref:FlG, two component system response regulator n=1 Tax=Streptomyces xinghaiensis TaxID=1038928 RepID=A0A068VNX2_9ACTN|nr:response regulator transcription factor [Streptomyces xinghaiensis]MZE81330.1 DNA-binding response regulator [Streptomyces sp. SID5475]CDP39158.1 FlG, two component system response regulator [Streptomyces xinghaiensis]
MPYQRSDANAGLSREPVISVAVVDASTFFRAGLVHFLSADDTFSVVAHTATLREMHADTGALRPDVLLIGVEHAAAEVLRDLARLRTAARGTRVVALLAADDPLTVRRALTAGVQAAIPRHATPQELAGTIRGIVRGDDRIVLSVPQHTLVWLREQTPQLLTSREREIIGLVARGLRNSQIADRLVITESTVKRHLSNVYAKLDAACRTEAVRKAVEHGAIPAVVAAARPAGGYEAAG